MHQLSAKWTLTEKYQAMSKNVDYKSTIVKICKISSVEELAFLLKNTIYGKITQIFSEPFKCKMYVAFKHFNEPEKEVQIEALEYFKDDIEPLWEHEKNEQGSEVQWGVKKEQLHACDDYYNDLILEIFGQAQDFLHHVNGLRVVDKINNNNQNEIRFELWLDIVVDKENEEVKNQIEGLIIQLNTKYKIEELKFKYASHKKK